MQLRNKAYAINGPRHGAVRRGPTGGPTDDVPSTAWLAAQQAFSGPRLAPDTPTVVVVRKGRAVVAAAPAVDVRPDDPPPAAEKPGRVFRVDPTRSGSAGDALERPTHHDARTLGEGAAVRRKRSVDPDKRPGPVHTVRVLVTPTPEQARPKIHAVSALDQIAKLRGMMAQVDVVLAEIKRARALRFVD